MNGEVSGDGQGEVLKGTPFTIAPPSNGQTWFGHPYRTFPILQVASKMS